MPNISLTIKDILAKIEIDTSIKYARIWNDQYNQIARGESVSIPWPNAFLEIVNENGSNGSDIGFGYAGYDIIFRVHVGMEEYDAQDGTLEQNFNIFDLKDEVIEALTWFIPTNTGRMECVNDARDYTHTNVYHYILDFKAHYIDGAGAQDTRLVPFGPPIELEIDTTVVDVIP